jgi:hypothetical protein
MRSAPWATPAGEPRAAGPSEPPHVGGDLVTVGVGRGAGSAGRCVSLRRS